MLTRLRSDEERYARGAWRASPAGTGPSKAPARPRCAPGPTCCWSTTASSALAYLNAHRVTPRLWRSAQPAPHQISRWFAQPGREDRSSICAAAASTAPGRCSARPASATASALVDFILRSRGAPERETILSAKGFLREPGGAGAGALQVGRGSAPASSPALYLLLHEKRPLDEAMRQLSLRYGHFRFAKTGILDAVLRGLSPTRARRACAFLDWVDTVYDPERLEQEFKPGFHVVADRRPADPAEK